MIPTDSYEYLKEHLGCKWSIAENQKHKRKWSTGETLKLSDLWDKRINCCQLLPNEMILESDYKDSEQYKNKENQEHAEALLQKYGAGYMITSHQGKSDYIWFRFKTSKPITPKLRLEIIRHLAKPELNFDEGFKSTKHIRPIPNRFHWKHSSYIEKVLKVVSGEDLDIDKIGIVEPINQAPAKLGSVSYSFEPKGWACSISIVQMSEKYNIKDCPLCSKPLNFIDKLGWWSCSGCGLKGGLKDFAAMVIKRKAEAVTRQ
jgi:hypothetical protein